MNMEIESDKKWKLSKTAYLKGRQCLKALYLHKQREFSKPDRPLNKPEQKGKSFEAHIHKVLFAGGINIADELQNNFKAYPDRTKELLDSHGEITLFEAGIVSSDAFIMVDVMIKNLNGQIEIYEIKNQSKLKSHTLWDAAFQYYVAKKHFGEQLVKFKIILRDRNNDYKILDIEDQITKRLSQVEAEIHQFKKMLRSEEEPQLAMGKQCDLPYACKYKTYCLANNLI